jgi:hypothetical protein
MKSFAMVAALLAGGTSLAMAQTAPSATGGAAVKHGCVGVRHGLVECHNKTHMSANGNGASSANGNGASSANANSASAKAASPASSMHGTDTVILSAAQRRSLWNELSKQATNQSASGFEAQTGTFLPKSVKIEPIPGKAAANSPQLQPYDYAMVDHDLVIVDPTSNVIADIVKK